MSDMKDYYKRRTLEYEKIYYRDDPARQEEQRKIASALKDALKNREVLEVACGTGYWTEFLSETAKRIVATDAVEEVLKIAKTKKYNCPVSFAIEDAYGLSYEDASFDGGMANFWLSHVPKNKIAAFLEGFHRTLKKDAVVFMADNNHVPKYGGKLVSKEGDNNTYKLRYLEDGSENLVLKNYYSITELEEIFSKYSESFNKKNILYGEHFWYLSYNL